MRKNLFFLFTFWSVITVFSQNAVELNQQSKELLQKNQYDKAMPLLMQAAELGNPEAQYNLAMSYYLGEGVGKDQHRQEAGSRKTGRCAVRPGAAHVLQEEARQDARCEIADGVCGGQ